MNLNETLENRDYSLSVEEQKFKVSKSIQATFWELRWEHVINVKEFIAR